MTNLVSPERAEGGVIDSDATRLARVKQLKQVVQEEHDFLMYGLAGCANAVLVVDNLTFALGLVESDLPSSESSSSRLSPVPASLRVLPLQSASFSQGKIQQSV